jgi:hypothetical protein
LKFLFFAHESHNSSIIDIILEPTVAVIRLGLRTLAFRSSTGFKASPSALIFNQSYERLNSNQKKLLGFSRSFSSYRLLEMRIATLQFAPKLGDVAGNINRANELLKKGKHISLDGQTRGVGIGIDLLRPDILVLPELALTGMLSPVPIDGLAHTLALHLHLIQSTDEFMNR